METLLPADPRTVGEYRILARLGAGGMGQVFLGVGPDGRHSAVKLIRADFESPDAVARFRREVATLAAVRSPHTAALLGAGLDAPPYWLATEYVPGMTLSEAVGRFGALPPEVCRKLAAGLAEALADVHRHGVQHRDLKPQNIILSRTGPRLIDFGIARGEDQTAITRTGGMVGTPGYLAPESVTRQELGPPADVFALAGVLAYASTGRPPFGGGDLHAVLYRSVHGELDLDGADPLVASVARACGAKDPAQRPPLSWVIEQCAGPDPLAEDPFYREHIATAVRLPPKDADEAQRTGLLPPPPTTAPAMYPGPPQSRRGARTGVILGAAAGVAAVLMSSWLVLQNLDRGPSTPAPTGTVSPDAASSAAPASTPGPDATPTEVSRNRTGLTTGGLYWSSETGRCSPQAPYEETPPPNLQWDAALETPKSQGSIDFGLRVKYGADPGYHIAAEVWPPGELNGSAGVHFVSRPKPMHDAEWTNFTYPRDFGPDAFFEKGDWTVIWYHVHADGEAYFINCNGFQVT